jgi:hypothetical protein
MHPVASASVPLDDMRELLARIDEIERDDLNAVRLRRLPD